MAIDRSGKWWKGSDSADIDRYLEDLTSDGYKADRFAHVRCSCGGVLFKVEADSENDCARRTCSACGSATLMLDSDESWDEAAPEECDCPCGNRLFEVAVGFSHRDDGSLKWVTIGLRCSACGVLGACADWKIDYAPADHLYTKA